MIKQGDQVSIEYTLSLEDGTVADSNVGQEPLVYRQGEGHILPVLEDALVGLGVNDAKQVTIEPDDGYGPVNPAAFQEVTADMIPEGAREVGAVLAARDEQGREQILRVHEVRGHTIILDFNHPLAGIALNFDLRILSIE